MPAETEPDVCHQQDACFAREGSGCCEAMSAETNLMLAQDKRPAVMERALSSLTDLTQTAGGDFLARRVTKEAWPLMQKHLQPPSQAQTRRGPILYII